jgi:cytochrome c peroxidase
MHRYLGRGVIAALALGALFARAEPPHPSGEAGLAPNTNGIAETISRFGFIDRTNPFFASLGTNGRACATCHVQAEGWTITPRGIRERFRQSKGLDPLFRSNDGAVSPLADVSTLEARRKAYSMLLTKGLVRVGLSVPADAEFELAAVDDPYGFASARELSLFRRPLPSTNLGFLSTLMWDGRETFLDPTSRDCIAGTAACFASMHFDLAHQSNEATLGHAQAARALTEGEREAIVAFETALNTAQVRDERAGRLTAQGARGGPQALAEQPFWFGINDPLVGDYRTGARFEPHAMSLYDAWSRTIPDASAKDAESRERGVAAARRAIAHGEQVFDEKPIEIRGVKGLNDVLGVPVIRGTCTTCHNAPNAGSHSVPMPLDIGLADASRRTSDLPLYTLVHKTTRELLQTTDPGRALVSGKWADIGKFKGPVLRALATRAPYFHNGSAADLDAVLDFYEQRFGIGFSADERADLVAFLRAL